MNSTSTTAQSQFVQVSTQNGGLVAKIVCHALSTRETEIVTDDLLTRFSGPEFKFLVVDLSQVTFMSSVGIGLLVQLHKRARESKVKFVVVGLNAELKALLKMTKLDKLFTIVDDPSKVAQIVG
jgi:anti-anti-sigma factor